MWLRCVLDLCASRRRVCLHPCCVSDSFFFQRRFRSKDELTGDSTAFNKLNCAFTVDATLGNAEVVSVSPVSSKKTASESGLSAHVQNNRVVEGGSPPPVAKNRFLQKLSEMEKKDGFSEVNHILSPQARERRREEKVLKERKSMLVFRDVGMDLDKPILSRDIFLVLKYFRYGVEFAVDNELERMLRYFNEHALNELKIIQNSKLMRGPGTLSKKKKHGVHGGVPFQVAPLFPSLQAANMLQFCNYGKQVEQRAIELLGIGSFSASFCRSKENSGLSSISKARFFDERDTSQVTTLSHSTFRRPALIILSQLGQKLGAQADLEWRRLGYAAIHPSLLQHFPKIDVTGDGHVASTHERHEGGLRPRTAEDSHSLKGRVMPLDVLSLRSMDVYKYRWVHKLYIRRFAQSLISPVTSAECATDGAQIIGLITASTTFVGSKLLQPFYSVLGLRNYLSPHVLLVDHEGVIRWLSAGCPDEYERERFPALLKQLEDEYYRAGGRC